MDPAALYRLPGDEFDDAAQAAEVSTTAPQLDNQDVVASGFVAKQANLSVQDRHDDVHAAVAVDIAERSRTAAVRSVEDLTDTVGILPDNPGSCFRYSDGQWVFNLRLKETDGFAPSRTHRVEVDLGGCILTGDNGLFQTK